MPDLNPYASPQSDQPPLIAAEGVSGFAGGAWREGNLLVMHRQAELPNRCVKCNAVVGQTRQSRLQRNLSWHHPAIYLAIFVALLVYVILALVLRKTATIHVGICTRCRGKRRNAILVGWALVLASLGTCILGIRLADFVGTASWTPWILIGSVILFFGGAIWGAIKASVVSAKKMDDTYIWLKGVHPAYLTELPPVQ